MGKLTEERRDIWKDVYRFYEEHWEIPDTSDAWAGCAADMARIDNKYGGTPLARQLLMACYTAIEQDKRAAREAFNNACG